RRAVWTAETSVLMRTGRSRSVMFDSGESRVSTSSSAPLARANTISGRSDQGSCPPSSSTMAWRVDGWSASSATRTAPAPCRISRNRSGSERQEWQDRPAWDRSWQVSRASRPVGASTRTRFSRGLRSGMEVVGQQRLGLPQIGELTPEHTLELVQLAPELQPMVADPQLADAALVRSRPLLDRRD